jgi:hypothetical protein
MFLPGIQESSGGDLGSEGNMELRSDKAVVLRKECGAGDFVGGL